MGIAIVVARASNGVIGRDGALPWHLSADLQHFKAITMGKPVVMGRLTHESIGRVLPGRENIVLSRNRDYRAAGCKVMRDLDEVRAYCRDELEIMVIGGASLYAEALPLAKRLYITEVHADPEGDVYFPAFDPDQWQQVDCQRFRADAKNDHDYSFTVLEKNCNRP